MKEVTNVTYVTEPTHNQEVWIIDSGASSHMCRDSTRFENLKTIDSSISGADRRQIPVTGQGRVRILTLDSTRRQKNTQTGKSIVGSKPGTQSVLHQSDC